MDIAERMKVSNAAYDAACRSSTGREIYRAAYYKALSSPGASKQYAAQMGWEARREFAQHKASEAVRAVEEVTARE